MTRPDVNSTLREWLAFRPGVSRIFAKHGADLCREADASLTELCRTRNLDPLLLAAELDRAAKQSHCEVGEDWAAAPLGELCQHIEAAHHAFYERELPRLAELAAKVAAKYAASHPETRQIEQTFQEFRARLESHCEREAHELFPVIRQLVETHSPAEPPRLDLAALINSLEQDHDAVDAILLRIRERTHGFVAPSGSCQTFQSLLDGLWELEMNLHQNVYEENRFLFPRALRHEAAMRSTETRMA